MLEKKCIGFTMVELMISVVILATGLIFILQSMNSGMFALNKAQKRYFAAKIAVERLEELEERDIKTNGLAASLLNEVVTLEGQEFTVDIEIAPQVLKTQDFPQIFPADSELYVVPEVKDKLQKVDVRVAWHERAAPRELVYSTYFDAKTLKE